MSRDAASRALSRRQLLGVAGVTLGAAVLGKRWVTDGATDCEGIDYATVGVRQGAVSGPVDGASYCRVEWSVAARLGVDAGDQLRLGAADADQDARLPEKLVTVAEVTSRGPGAIRANDAALEAIGVESGRDAVASATVPHPCHETKAAAIEHGELVETLHNGGASDASLVLLAPHGGYVEPGTGEQAAHAADRFDLPAWSCYGANAGGDAYERWHVPSTELSDASFPELETVAASAYPAALAFHGRSFDGAADPDPYVGVGGRATRLKDAVVDALREAYRERGVETPVCRLSDDACQYSGTDPENVVNRVTDSGDGGVQLEQPPSVRDDHGRLTARVAVDAILAALQSSESVQTETNRRCSCGDSPSEARSDRTDAGQ